MPEVNCKSVPVDARSLHAMAMELASLSPKVRPKLVDSLDEVRDLLDDTRADGRITRFRTDDFPRLTIVWRWFGSGVGAAHMLVDGSVQQVHLMLAGPDAATEPAVRQWLDRAGVVTRFDGPAPMLICLANEPAADDSGAYLAGMLIFAPFCETCGV